MSCSWRINITWLEFQYPTLRLSSGNCSETRSIYACLSPGRILVYQHDHLLALFGFKYKYLSYMSSWKFTLRIRLRIWRFTVAQLLRANCMEHLFLRSRNQLHGAEPFLRNWYQPVPWSRVVVDKLIVTANETVPSFVGLNVPVVEVHSLCTCTLLACMHFFVERSLCMCVLDIYGRKWKWPDKF